MVFHANYANAANYPMYGFDDNELGAALDYLYITRIGTTGYYSAVTGSLTAGRDYYFAIILRAAGAYYFVKEELQYPRWTLIFATDDTVATPLYPLIGVRNSWTAGENTSAFAGVPLETWLPIPLLYDTFTGANGTALDTTDSDTTGPDGQTTPSLTCVEQAGNWDIQANRANPDGAGIVTWDIGEADVMIDCIVNGGAAGQPGIVFRYADANNYWYLQADRAANQLELHEVNGGADNLRTSTAVVINDSTDYMLRVFAYGTQVYGYIDSENRISYALAWLNETSTLHGLYSDNAACEFDDLLIFARE